MCVCIEREKKKRERDRGGVRRDRERCRYRSSVALLFSHLLKSHFQFFFPDYILYTKS